MKTIVGCLVHCLRELTARNAACLAGGPCSSWPDARAIPRRWCWASPPRCRRINEYCAVAQKEIASSRVPARNVLMTDYQAFSRAAPSINPLETMQFVGYADPQRLKARMISCKLHSPERIRAEYGATAAGEATSCARLNRRTLDAVMLIAHGPAEEEDAVQGHRSA